MKESVMRTLALILACLVDQIRAGGVETPLRIFPVVDISEIGPVE